MLDQSDYLSRYDQHDILGVIANQPNQLLHQFTDIAVDKIKGATMIVVAGMGGSALAAEFIKNWLGDRLPVPLVITRGYELPAFVGRSTLVIVSSYSGNTEESLSCLAEATKRRARVVVLAAGGQLIETAAAQNLALFRAPAGLQPRLAVLYGVRAIAQLLEAIGWNDELVKELETAARWLKNELTSWQADSVTDDNSAKQLAEALVGRPVVIYGGPVLSLPAMKWKIDANENAKHLAFYNYLPEFNHNEFLGWAHPKDLDIRVVELRSVLDHPQIQKRFDATNRLLAGIMPDPIIVTAHGQNKLEQMLWTILLGDFTMAYLAFLNQVDPTPVPLIEKLKHELA